jgi:FMN phosphatase YigB (HAD superfamily)
MAYGLNVPPDRIMAVSDNLRRDILPAHGVGMWGAWIHSSSPRVTSLEITPEYKIESIQQVPAIIDFLNSIHL